MTIRARQSICFYRAARRRLMMLAEKIEQLNKRASPRAFMDARIAARLFGLHFSPR